MLTIGDSLLRKISEGLNQSDFGIVVLSNHFFSKKWPQAELDGLFSLETVERKVVLALWKDVNEGDVKAFSPILAGKLAAMAAHGVAAVVEEINALWKRLAQSRGFLPLRMLFHGFAASISKH